MLLMICALLPKKKTEKKRKGKLLYWEVVGLIPVGDWLMYLEMWQKIEKGKNKKKKKRRKQKQKQKKVDLIVIVVVDVFSFGLFVVTKFIF